MIDMVKYVNWLREFSYPSRWGDMTYREWVCDIVEVWGNDIAFCMGLLQPSEWARAMVMPYRHQHQPEFEQWGLEPTIIWNDIVSTMAEIGAGDFDNVTELATYIAEVTNV